MMTYLGTISRHGILVTARHGNVLWLDPQELVTDEIRQLVREHRDELIAEIRSLAGQTDSIAEITPAYRFLWVATNLESFEEYDPRFGYEVGRDPVYRMLDAPYYAWLRHRMANVRKSYEDGGLDSESFDVLRSRFNTIHNWAVAHIGEENLRRAVRTTNLKRYVPPSDETIAAYHRTWDDARRANQSRHLEHRASRSARLRQLLSTQGYAGIKSPVLDDLVVFVRDDGVTVPTKWSAKARFTMDELSLMIGSSVDAVKQIYDIKQVFGGKVVPYDGPAVSAACRPVAGRPGLTVQQSMF